MVAGALAVLGLSACNSQDGPQAIEPDWVHHPSDPTPHESPSPNPDPEPSALPSPAPSGNPTDLYTGPAEVAPFVAKFVADGVIQGVDVLPDMKNPKLEIRIASLDSYGGSVIGLCETGGGRRRVTFDPDFWNSVSDTQKELLAHHELGHCVLYRPHRTATLSSGAYASIMYPIIMSSTTYKNNYDYYQEELFTYGAAVSDPNMVVTHVCDAEELMQGGGR